MKQRANIIAAIVTRIGLKVLITVLITLPLFLFIL